MIGRTNARTLSVSGGGGLFNFPLTFSDSEPTAEDAIRSGHIWIMRSERTDAISNIYIAEAPTVDMPDGSLILQIYDYKNIELSISQEFDVEKNKAQLEFAGFDITGNHPWLAGYNETGTEVYLAAPKITIKYNGTLYLETAWWWDGQNWILISRGDTYMAISTDTKSPYIQVYSRENETPLTEIEGNTFPSPNDWNSIVISKNIGEYMAVCNGYSSGCIEGNNVYDSGNYVKVYKKVGSEFQLYSNIGITTIKGLVPSVHPNNSSLKRMSFAFGEYTWNSRISGSNSSIHLSPDGRYLFVMFCAVYGTYTSTSDINLNTQGTSVIGVLIFENNYEYNDFRYKRTVLKSAITAGAKTHLSMDISMSDDCGVMYCSGAIYTYDGLSATSTTWYPFRYLFVGNPEQGYEEIEISVSSSYSSYDGNGTSWSDTRLVATMRSFALSSDGTMLLAGEGSKNNGYYIRHNIYKIDRAEKTVTYVTYLEPYYARGYTTTRPMPCGSMIIGNYAYTLYSEDSSDKNYAYVMIIHNIETGNEYKKYLYENGNRLNNCGTGYGTVMNTLTFYDNSNAIITLPDKIVKGAIPLPQTTSSAGGTINFKTIYENTSGVDWYSVIYAPGLIV